ncbi:hypothetical protein PVAG01_09406 [Phlyctema vagabunda]|uniref:NADH dehydrogenase [ubiquinone] 1 alpha subcomplex subunit 1 n=1 Tax=Phlyctema vagabunda TaxID=108571 RepID=A0ABR4P796_9HELO
MFHPSQRMMMHASRRMQIGMPNERIAGTTRIHFQKLRAIPVEVYPLGVVVGFMVSIATFSLAKALFFGKNLRKHRTQHVWE